MITQKYSAVNRMAPVSRDLKIFIPPNRSAQRFCAHPVYSASDWDVYMFSWNNCELATVWRLKLDQKSMFFGGVWLTVQSGVWRGDRIQSFALLSLPKLGWFKREFPQTRCKVTLHSCTSCGQTREPHAGQVFGAGWLYNYSLNEPARS